MKQSRIIVRIFGGLGNQLFCYAAARRLALVNNAALRIDAVSGFKYDSQYRRIYLLDRFNIKASIASLKESFDFTGGRFVRYIRRKVDKFIRFEKRSYIVEELRDRFDPRMMEIRPEGNIYLEGYWHSTKYFADIEEDLRRELTIIAPHEDITIKESQAIRNANNPVCLGIRRFQEVKNSNAHHVLSKNYYLAAIDKVAAAVPDAHFFVFCNDGEWVSKNLEIRYPYTVITPKPESERACEDLWLMSWCNHFIIPNSTYHWWGAWLSERKNKIVIAPREGFYNKDIIPDEWIRI